MIPCHAEMITPPAETLPAVAAGDTRGTLEALLADLRAWRRAYEAQRIAAEACAAAPGGPRIDDLPQGSPTPLPTPSP